MSDRADAAGLSPFDRLRAWEDSIRATPRELPQGDPPDSGRWTGIGFLVAGERVMAPMSQVLEIGPYPKLTRVPGCKAWLRGIANARGRVVAVVDLAGFLRVGDTTPVSPRSRVLEVRDESVPVGLLVAEMAGLRHFRAAEQAPDPRVPPWLAPFFTGSIDDAAGHWTVLDLTRIVRHPEFMRVSL